MLLTVVVATLALGLLGFALQLYLLHKLRRVHLNAFELLEHAKATRAEAETLFTQLQCLGLLERVLAMPQALPPMRGWAGSPDFLLHVARHTLARKPQVVVECSSGVSTVVLARCMQLNGHGHVFSLEHDSIYSRKTREMLLEHGLESWAEVIDAPLVTKDSATPWYDESAFPAGLHNVELLVVDGPPQATAKLARYPAMGRLLSRMSTHFTIFVDDAARADETEMVARWLREVPGTTSETAPAEKGLLIVHR